MVLIQPSLPKAQKRYASSSTPVSLYELDPDMPALDEADTERNDEDIETVLDDVETFSPPRMLLY